MNTIIGNTKEQLNNNPPETHDKYSALNDSLRGRFASSTASLEGALKEGEAEWINMLVAMSKITSTSKINIPLHFGWLSDLTAVQASQLMAHLPLNIEGLRITHATSRYGAEFWDTLIERIKQFKSLKTLNIVNSW